MTESTSHPEHLASGDTCQVTVERMAHGGEGIGTVAGRVVFVRGGLPGDTCTVRIAQAKKRFARGDAVEILEASPLRVQQRCPAAAKGAGCCDYGVVDPDAEVGLKVDVLRDQLTRLGGFTTAPAVESAALHPVTGWRTRVRLGVDSQGRAGLHKARSHELVTDAVCSQVLPGLLDGVVGDGARRFTPDAQVIVAQTDEGRQIVETRKTGRGRRAERVSEIIEGPEAGRIEVAGREFRVAAPAFWQAHVAAPAAYSRLVERFVAAEPAATRDSVAAEAGRERVAEDAGKPASDGSATAPEGLDADAAGVGDQEGDAPKVGWDLYGGVGLFVPALAAALGEGAAIHTVDSSPSARAGSQPALKGIDHHVHPVTVERAVAELPHPDAVVLDPPRTGAGAEVVAAVAAAHPGVVVHVGCDPATLSRDLSDWRKNGYWLTDCQLVDAFPGTHHFEVVCRLEPADPAGNAAAEEAAWLSAAGDAAQTAPVGHGGAAR